MKYQSIFPSATKVLYDASWNVNIIFKNYIIKYNLQ